MTHVICTTDCFAEGLFGLVIARGFFSKKRNFGSRLTKTPHPFFSPPYCHLSKFSWQRLCSRVSWCSLLLGWWGGLNRRVSYGASCPKSWLRNFYLFFVLESSAGWYRRICWQQIFRSDHYKKNGSRISHHVCIVTRKIRQNGKKLLAREKEEQQ